jgi:hypothetical protein
MIQTLITDYFYPINKNKNKKRFITDYYQKIAKNNDNTYYETNEDIMPKKRKIIYGYNNETGSWHCLMCGVDMGPSNPRQLCRKSYCENI